MKIKPSIRIEDAIEELQKLPGETQNLVAFHFLGAIKVATETPYSHGKVSAKGIADSLDDAISFACKQVAQPTL